MGVEAQDRESRMNDVYEGLRIIFALKKILFRYINIIYISKMFVVAHGTASVDGMCWDEQETPDPNLSQLITFYKYPNGQYGIGYGGQAWNALTTMKNLK